MTPLPIAVLGATGAVGEALLARLATSEFAHADIGAYASRAARKESVALGERSLQVLQLDALAETEVRLAFNALPANIAKKYIPALVGRGCFVIDVGNGCAGIIDAPLVLPGLRPPNAADMASAGAARTPSAVGWLIASVLGPIMPLGATAVSGLVNLPATIYGQRASEELSEQVVASFNLKDPPRRIFPDGLAFDTLPEDVDGGEWSERELLASAEVGELLGIDPGRCAVTCCTQPVFAGMTAALHIRGQFTADKVETVLGEAGGLSTATRVRSLRPRKVMGRSPVYWSSIRNDPMGDGVHIWLAADNLAGAGAAVPVSVAEAVLSAGLLTRMEA